MRRISANMWSHESISTGERYSVNDIRCSRSKKILSFRELVGAVAEVGYHNSEHVLFFRGQKRAYKKRMADGSRGDCIYPSIYRSPGRSLSTVEIEERFRVLNKNAGILCREWKKEDFLGHERLTKFPELAWAVLQHYEVCPTPLVDITSSLRVAASFALLDDNEEGWLYVFGFPHPNGSITYSSDYELLNIRLLSICPPEAQRPHFQEGFLVGTFPSTRMRKHPSLDVAVRLIAKFRLIQDRFWDDDFHMIPSKALYPTDDRIWHMCEILKGTRAMQPPKSPRK